MNGRPKSAAAREGDSQHKHALLAAEARLLSIDLSERPATTDNTRNSLAPRSSEQPSQEQERLIQYEQSEMTGTGLLLQDPQVHSPVCRKVLPVSSPHRPHSHGDSVQLRTPFPWTLRRAVGDVAAIQASSDVSSLGVQRRRKSIREVRVPCPDGVQEILWELYGEEESGQGRKSSEDYLRASPEVCKVADDFSVLATSGSDIQFNFQDVVALQFPAEEGKFDSLRSYELTTGAGPTFVSHFSRHWNYPFALGYFDIYWIRI
ncbi:unnamed protein product [Diplocarpon coronariae]